VSLCGCVYSVCMSVDSVCLHLCMQCIGYACAILLVYLQQELEAIHQQLKAGIHTVPFHTTWHITLPVAQLDFRKEKVAHEDLKQTWINANHHFLELQAQYEGQIKSLEFKLK